MEVVVAKYDASKNLWTHLGVNDDGEFVYVVEPVKLRWTGPVWIKADLPNISWENIDNWYEMIGAAPSSTYTTGYLTPWMVQHLFHVSRN